MLEKFLKGTYSFERQLGKNIVFSKDEIAIIHKRKAFWEKLVHIENLINLPYFSQINQSELNMLLGEKGFEAKENDDLKEWEAMDQAIRNKKYGSVDLPKFKWINPTTQKAEDDTPFINFFIPFIKYAKGRLDEQINKCGTRYLVNDNLQKDMVKILIGHLYKLCIRVLILELVEIFKTVKVRQIIRSTQQYSTLLNIGTHPDYLRSGLDREMLFTTLYKEGKFEKKYNLVAPYEIKDLLDNDIPFFVNYPDETKLLHSRGKIEGVYEERGIDLVKGQLENMSEENCEIQLNFIRMSLMDEEKYTVNPVLVRRHDKDEKRLLEIECYKKAKEIGEELARTAISGNSAEDIGWIITNVTGVEETNWSVEPSGIDLYNGTPGILLFMAALYKITREEKYLEITKRGMNGIIKTLEKCLSIKNEMEKETVIGAYTGETSNLFTLIVIGDIIGEDYTELCSKILSNTINVVDKDENFDVVAGAAGCILQTYNVVGRKGLEKKSIELISKCADYLIVKATKKDDMMMWKPQIASNALAGYSHGAAGIALALIKAGEILGKIEYFIAAEKALNYERSLYVEKEKNWADIRALGGVTNYSQGIIPATWCHGAPGILMSRIIMLEYIKEEKAIKKIKKEIEVSLETTIFKGFGKSHCLCHGDLGNIDILLQASNYSDKEKINNVVYSYLDANISKFKLGRYKCGLPGQNNTPSLMIGLAGIGYEFLKIYDSSLPSVLSLSVDK